ncbi:MAG: nitrous oxide reductase family maturation protein NosD [Cyclobacteriaceae bacterium]|nr:nitrous oxide reductase family maturation protein NosD [Cyclobacteriaceae bacterium]
MTVSAQLYFLIVLFSLPGVFLTSAHARIFHVYPNAKQNLQETIAMAGDGDTVYIHQGHYFSGNITVKNQLLIEGIDMPVLDGNLKDEILTIAARKVIIRGIHFKNTGRSSINDLAAIKCLDAHGIRVENCILENTFFGIYLSNTDSSVIRNNRLEAFAENEYQLGNGIHLWKCKNALIEENEIKGHRDGIYFEFVTDSQIRDNISNENMRYGLHFMFSHDDVYERNIFRKNGAGVAVMYSRRVHMYYNRFEDNWGSSSYGMLLKDISDSEVIQNQFKGNTIGIFMEGTSRTLFEKNLFAMNGWAIKLQASCDDNVLRYNNFSGNTFDISTNGSLVLNTIDSNYWDRYQGYDLDRDGVGDIPFRPVSMFSIIVERVPPAIMLWRSFLVFLLDKVEKIIPVITPENMQDQTPSMKPYDIHTRS